jgi:hypothetical protein
MYRTPVEKRRLPRTGSAQSRLAVVFLAGVCERPLLLFFGRQVESLAPKPQTYKPASTALLIASLIFAGGLWALDCTSMSLHWVVARLPKS